jgi:hypothetical protein
MLVMYIVLSGTVSSSPRDRQLNLSNKLVSIRVMVFNATFNNISVIPWLSFLFVEETGIPGENHRPDASH